MNPLQIMELAHRKFVGERITAVRLLGCLPIGDNPKGVVERYLDSARRKTGSSWGCKFPRGFCMRPEVELICRTRKFSMGLKLFKPITAQNEFWIDGELPESGGWIEDRHEQVLSEYLVLSLGCNISCVVRPDFW